MLTNFQLEELCDKMGIPLEGIYFKSDLKDLTLKYNKSYIINLENELNEDGERNEGSHWTCFQVNEIKDKSLQGIWFDSYGAPSPVEVNEFVGQELPCVTFNLQSLMSSACGWFCCAFLHFINAFPNRSGDLYADPEAFLSMFDDLNKSCDFKKNEFILKHFFQASDPALRTPISVEENQTGLNTETIV